MNAHGEYAVGSALGQPARRPPERLERRGHPREVEEGPESSSSIVTAGHRAGRGVRKWPWMSRPRGTPGSPRRPGGAHVQDTVASPQARLRETGIATTAFAAAMAEAFSSLAESVTAQTNCRPSPAGPRSPRCATARGGPGHHPPPVIARRSPDRGAGGLQPDWSPPLSRLLPSPAPERRCTRKKPSEVDRLTAAARSSPCSARSQTHRGPPRHSWSAAPRR